mmetsp:Transcript_75439/g.180227  ORF Transcript_75439/g.180227 Transcript_75439/m.180227 type:complete len:124 (+) Transcript_75439:484-855(+)
MEIADVWLDLFGQTWDLSVRDVAACRQHTSVQVQGVCCGHFGRPHQRVLGRALWEVSTSHAVVHFPVLQAKNECKGTGCCCGWRCGCSGAPSERVQRRWLLLRVALWLQWRGTELIPQALLRR